MASSISHYVGRFAPSPTGPLHFGSLVTALASYLEAKCQQGQWLVRIEDIDPPREQPGASQLILTALQIHGLHWDADVMFQSERIPAYRQALQRLQADNQVYACACSRQRLSTLPNGYDGYCLAHPPSTSVAVAFKLKCGSVQYTFTDQVQGEQHPSLCAPRDDFVVWRKDGLVAYQLAVVVDDIAQNVSHIVRGYDLFDSTVRQARLWQLLGAQPPQFAHLPLVENERGQKLSKQNHAAALDLTTPEHNLVQALHFLGHSPPGGLLQATVKEILDWALGHWDIARLRKQTGRFYDYGQCPTPGDGH